MCKCESCEFVPFITYNDFVGLLHGKVVAGLLAGRVVYDNVLDVLENNMTAVEWDEYRHDYLLTLEGFAGFVSEVAEEFALEDVYNG